MSKALVSHPIFTLMNKSYFHIFFLFWMCSAVFAQDGKMTFKGRLLNTNKKPVSGVRITFTNTKPPSIITMGDGTFTVNTENLQPRPSAFSQEYEFKTVYYTVDKDENLMTIIVAKPNKIKGEVKEKGRYIANIKVEIAGIGETYTDKEGKFTIKVPDDFKALEHNYKVNGVDISVSKDMLREGNYFLFEKPEKPVVKYNYELTLIDTEKKPVSNQKAAWGAGFFDTDSTGKAKVSSILSSEQILKEQATIIGYDFVEIKPNGKNAFVLTFKKNADSPASTEIPKIENKPENMYAEDFNNVINQLELDKQLLAQRNGQIRGDIQAISFKLNATENIDENQRKALKEELEILEKALVSNEVAYEDAQAKTREVVDQIKVVLLEKDSLNKVATQAIEVVEKVQEEKAQEERLFIVVALFLLSLVLVLFFAARRIRKERNEVLKAYSDIATLSEIGQKVAAVLEFDNLVATVHQNVDALMDASVFGVGAYHPKEGTIVFRKFFDEGQIIPYYEENTNNKNKFAVWCLENLRPVLIQDLAVDYKKYLNLDSYPVAEGLPKSLIYLPLMIEGRAVGVITVQSLRKAAYTEREVTLLSTLASYVAIALVNSRSYEVIREKNRNITDSIRYAKTIQQAILPSVQELREAFGEHFIIYRPKDIVSGDFYWFVQDIDKNRKFIAAVDCTGHGVPGAFMSMIGYAMLNETIRAKKIYEPALILEYMDSKVKETLKQDETANDDGMDICFCMLEAHPQGAKLVFAGAKRPLYYIKKGQTEVQQLKGDGKSIGGANLKEKNFHDKEIILNKGDMIYLTSDGLIDQANDSKEKFGTPRLLKLLSENAHIGLSQQKQNIELQIDQYRQNTEQRDDILVIGIRI